MHFRFAIRTLALLALVALAAAPMLATAPDETVADGAELPTPELQLEEEAPNLTPAPERDRTPQVDPGDDLRFEAIYECDASRYCHSPEPTCFCLNVGGINNCYC